VRTVPARWWCTLAILLLTAAAASIDALDETSGLDWLELVAYACGIAALIVLPVAVGRLWPSLLLACFATGWAFVLGLALADLLTYDTVWHRCNYPQLDACDPGPFPATMAAPVAVVPVVAAIAGHVARFGSDQFRKRRGEQAHLLIGPDGHADGAGSAEPS
jgi:hypothetical protein